MQINIKKIIALFSVITIIFIATAIILLRKPIGKPKFEYREFEARYEMQDKDEIVSFIMPEGWWQYGGSGGSVYKPGETIYMRHKDIVPPRLNLIEDYPTTVFAISPSNYYTDDEYRQIVDDAISGEYSGFKKHLAKLTVARYYGGISGWEKTDGYFIHVNTYNIDGGKIIMFEESVPRQGATFRKCTYICTKYPQYLFVTGSGKNVSTEYTDKRPWIIQSFEIN